VKKAVLSFLFSVSKANIPSSSTQISKP